MGIGGVKAMDGMTGMQRTAARSVDFADRNIRDEISEVKRQKQGLSSRQEMSVEEKAEKRQELQQELSSLNTKLRLRQAEARKEQQAEAMRREALAEEAQAAGGSAGNAEGGREAAGAVEDGKVKDVSKGADAAALDEKAVEKEVRAAESRDAEEEDIDNRNVNKKDADQRAAGGKEEELEDIGVPAEKMRTLVEQDFSGEQTRRREAVIARMESGIVILKGEIRQDELRGADVDKKKAELKKQEQKVQRAASGIPNVKGPSRAADAAQAKTEAEREESRAAAVRRSRDGVVIVTTQELTNNEFQARITMQ